MHDAEGAREALVGQVRVERGELCGGEHALVDHAGAGERGEVDAELVLGALAYAEDAGIELGDVLAGDAEEELGEVRHATAGRGADVFGVDGEFTPAKNCEAFVEGQFLEGGDGLGPLCRLLGQECRAGGVVAGGRKGESRDGAEEGVGDLGEDAGTVSGAVVGAHGAAVFEPAQGLECLVHDRV